MIGKKALKPGEVFTPRKPLNERMYVERADLEKRFLRAIDGTQHVAIFGDSGSGKTWLYQKVLKAHGIPYRLVDLAIARTGGIENAFRAALSKPYGWVPEVKDETRTGGVNVGIKAQEERNTQYSFADEPPFDKLVNEMAKIKGANKFLIFDNFEQISDDVEVLRALAGYIIQLDNPRFFASGVRFLLVGVVSDIKNMISKNNHSETISNRIFELPEVKRLSRAESKKVFETGFLDLLNLKFDDPDEIIHSCIYYSGRNAQQIHEIGYNVGCEAVENPGTLTWKEVSTAIVDWANTSIAGHTGMVVARLNKFSSKKIQRRNQVLYCLAKTYLDDFSPSDTETLIREEFPHTTSAGRIGVDQILKGLADGDSPILIRDISTNRYRFRHPKLRIAIRYVLRKDAEGDITKNQVIDRPYFD